MDEDFESRDTTEEEGIGFAKTNMAVFTEPQGALRGLHTV